MLGGTMTSSINPIELDRFRDWLADHGEYDVVGKTNSSTECPLATYLKYRFPTAIRCEVDNSVTVSTQDEYLVDAHATFWQLRFMDEIDVVDQDAALLDVTAGVALHVLCRLEQAGLVLRGEAVYAGASPG
jgi:hypothetical protein